MSESEIARLRQLIAEEYQAAKNGLFGLASGTARHTFITARMEKIGEYQQRVIEIVGSEQEASRLVAETLEYL